MLQTPRWSSSEKGEAWTGVNWRRISWLAWAAGLPPEATSRRPSAECALDLQVQRDDTLGSGNVGDGGDVREVAGQELDDLVEVVHQGLLGTSAALLFRFGRKVKGRETYASELDGVVLGDVQGDLQVLERQAGHLVDSSNDSLARGAALSLGDSD